MNTLFPIFVKLDQVHTLLVGAGNVAEEKLRTILFNSPKARVSIVAEHVSEEVRLLVASNGLLTIEERSFVEVDLEGKDLVIVASNNLVLNDWIRELSQRYQVLLNVADKPDLCDFYLGSVVRKGNLKVAISTNGKSPTMAKRVKEFLNDLLPQEIDETLELMQMMREQVKGDFQEKVRVLNAHTKSIIEK